MKAEVRTEVRLQVMGLKPVSQGQRPKHLARLYSATMGFILSLSLSLFLFASDTGARKVAHWIRVLSLQA